jgi:glutamine amidotransferase
VLFHLGLTFGLEEDPLAAIERTIGLVEATARTHDIQNAVQASIGITDGERLWAIRYSTEGRSRTLFHSAEPDTVRALYGDDPRLGRVREEDRLVVSEPFSDLPGLWVEIPEATALVVQPGDDVQVPFQPRVDETVNGRHPAGAA